MTRIGYGEEAALREQLRESEMRVLSLKGERDGALLAGEMWKEVADHHNDMWMLACAFGNQLVKRYWVPEGECPQCGRTDVHEVDGSPYCRECGFL